MQFINHLFSSKRKSTAYLVCFLSFFFVLLLDDSCCFYKNYIRRGVSVVAAASGTSSSTSSSDGYDLPIYPTLASLPTFDEYLVFMNGVISQSIGGDSAPAAAVNASSKANVAVEKHESNSKKGSYSTLRKGQEIPRILWIAMTDISEGLNYQLPELFNRNPTWSVQICDNKCKDAFMDKYFKGTAFYWAYDIVSRDCGAARADMWRYAVLWLFGGAYVDDDSDIRTPFDQFINPQDTLIVSYEKNGYNGDGCYIPRYHLSDAYLYEKNMTRKNIPKEDVFHGRVLLNWAIIAAPFHPIVSRAMENIVEIIKSEYFREPYLRHLRLQHRWVLIMCATGPSLLTGTAREMVIFQSEFGEILDILKTEKIDTRKEGHTLDTLKELLTTKYNRPDLWTRVHNAKVHHHYNFMSNHLTSLDFTYRLAGSDFGPYGGRFKAVYVRVRDNPNHYMNLLGKKGSTVHLLADYKNETNLDESTLKTWENEVIQAQNGKQIFVMQNGKKRGIPNYETFLALKYTMSVVRVISDDRVDKIPTGADMPVLKCRWEGELCFAQR